MKRLYIITGVNGHLGGTIIRCLRNTDCSIRELILSFETGKSDKQVTYYHGDVTKQASLEVVLSVLAGFIGLPLGTLFYRIVKGMIVIDNMAFDVYVTVASYALSLLCTILFALAVNLFMKRQIGKIQMAESLKAVE